MRFSLRTTTLIILAMIFCQANSQQLLDNRRDYCKDIVLDSNLLSASDSQKLRNKNWNDFYTDYHVMFDFFQDKTSGNFIKMMNYQFGLYITLVLLILITFLVFLFIFCCRCKCNCRPGCWYTCFWLFILFFLIFIGLFAAILVFLGISQNKASTAYCSAFSLPAAVIYGNPGAYHKQEFIGYQQFVYFAGNYTQEIGNLRNVNANANNIVNSNIPATTSSAINTLLQFKVPFNNQKVNNGDGQQVIPDSIAQNPASVSAEIHSQFSSLDVLGRALTTTASEVRFAQSPAYENDVKAGLTVLNQNIQVGLNNLTWLANNFTKDAFYIQSYGIAGFWTFFGLGVMIIILSFIAIVLVCVMRNGHKSGCLTCVKVLLVFIAFFAVVYGIAVLIMMAGVSGISVFCKFIGELNQGGHSATTALSKYIGPQPANLINSCIFKNSTGYIPDTVSSTPYIANQYNRLINLVDGLDQNNIYLDSNPGYSIAQSSAILNQVNVWNSISNGIIYDNQYVLGNLTGFQNSASCDPNKYDLTSDSCSFFKISNCKGISQSATYSPNSCVSGTSAGSKYTNLHQYITNEMALLGQMSAGLNGASSLAYSNSIIAFRNNLADVRAINSTIPKTLGSIQDYPNNSIKRSTQCSNLQAEFSQFERYVCFRFGKPLYVLLVLALISTFFLFCMLWAMYIAIIAKENSGVEYASGVRTVVQKGEFLAVNEQELVPKY